MLKKILENEPNKIKMLKVGIRVLRNEKMYMALTLTPKIGKSCGPYALEQKGVY